MSNQFPDDTTTKGDESAHKKNKHKPSLTGKQRKKLAKAHKIARSNFA